MDARVQASPFGRANATFSCAAVEVFHTTMPSSFRRAITSTPKSRRRGAGVSPTRLCPVTHFSCISSAAGRSCRQAPQGFRRPRAGGWSWNWLGDPTTITTSHCGAKRLDASWRFCVA